MGKHRIKRSNYLKKLDMNRIWVRTDVNGIRVVEMHGFREMSIMDMPNEMHIEGFHRRTGYLFSMLGMDDGGKRVMKELGEIEDKENGRWQKRRPYQNGRS